MVTCCPVGEEVSMSCMSTALMGARASHIGGIHLHKLFGWQPQKDTIRPYQYAEQAMQKIMRSSTLQHALLTVDVLFIDEAGQLAAELLSVIDIMFRKLRKSVTPFGGVLITGTMDHTQLQPINALPFLLSSHILTCFTMVQLKVSVRAHFDPLFQEFQEICRRNPFDLRTDAVAKERFYYLAQTIFTYVSDWGSDEIKPVMTRIFSRKNSVKDETRLFTDGLIETLKRRDDVPFFICKAVDSHKRGLAEYTPASPASIKSLNNALREPETLVFFPYALYEVTTNDTSNGLYNHSNLALLVDMPDEQTLEVFGSIRVLIAPPGTQHVES